jgi:hypothetical protein
VSACPSCGASTTDASDFCSSCGAYLRWEEEEAAEQITEVHAIEPEPVAVQTATAVLDPTVTVPADQVSLTLTLPGGNGADGPPTVGVEAGGRANLAAKLFNQSGIVDTYDLRIRGLPDDWYTITPATVNLLPFGAEQDHAEEHIQISLHPPQSPEAEARQWPIALVARSRSRGEDAVEAPGAVVIAPFERFECRVRPQLVRGQATAEYLVPVRNLGNSPLRVTLSGEDDEGMTRFIFDPPQLTIPAGGEARAALTVAAARLRDAPEQRRALSVVVEGPRQRTENHATFLQTPTITRKVPWWLIFGVAGALLIALSALTHWDRGVPALCGHGRDHTCLSYETYVHDVHSQTTLHPPDVGGLNNVFDFVTSLGILALALGLAVLVGLRARNMTLIAGILAVILAVVMLATLGFTGGLAVLLVGGVLAAVGGAIAPRK